MNKTEIEKWLKRFKIINYIIHDNLVVDVDGSVNLYNHRLKSLPFQFGKVTGDFYCDHNLLTSLRYCPTAVGGTFSCSHNNLTSLRHCPTSVGGNFYCSDNLLTSLQHCPNSIGGRFICNHNNLTSLQYCPTAVGNFHCCDNPLKVTETNQDEWLHAIMNNDNVYPYIEKPTEKMTQLHKMLWEI